MKHLHLNLIDITRVTDKPIRHICRQTNLTPHRLHGEGRLIDFIAKNLELESLHIIVRDRIGCCIAVSDGCILALGRAVIDNRISNMYIHHLHDPEHDHVWCTLEIGLLTTIFLDYEWCVGDKVKTDISSASENIASMLWRGHSIDKLDALSAQLWPYDGSMLDRHRRLYPFRSITEGDPMCDPGYRISVHHVGAAAADARIEECAKQLQQSEVTDAIMVKLESFGFPSMERQLAEARAGLEWYKEHIENNPGGGWWRESRPGS